MEEVNGTIEITRSGFGVLKRFIKLPNVKLKRCRTPLKKSGVRGHILSESQYADTINGFLKKKTVLTCTLLKYAIADSRETPVIKVTLYPFFVKYSAFCVVYIALWRYLQENN
jgi:hypothetical protein